MRNYTGFHWFMSIVVLTALLSVATIRNSVAQSVSQLSDEQRRELTVFGIRAGLGIDIGPAGVKNVLAGADLEKMIATGLNGNQFLCAEIVSVFPLRLKSKYEVTCIENAGAIIPH